MIYTLTSRLFGYDPSSQKPGPQKVKGYSLDLCKNLYLENMHKILSKVCQRGAKLELIMVVIELTIW